jgi:WD40 repeat protein
MPLDGHSSAVNSVKLSPNGNQILSGADDRSIKLWDVAIGTEYMTRLKVMAEES